ncbi:MAG TPA: dTMP kinase [Campylobacterales bacterium]|nr:dTMP kinase [Campylobacterales bacterium]HHS91915.1 dTMP kinase [Campylobacterales bacterium]
MYILFEGIDTCGKSTQIARLKEEFPAAILTKEPGGTAFGVQAREILLSDILASKRAELLLFLADRAEHYAQIVKNNKHKLVISDRGFLSGIGYALANDDFDFDHLIELNKFALEEQFPDLIVLFITNIETVQERLKSRNEEADGIEIRGLEYLMRVQKHMEESLQKLNIPYLLIDATQSIDEIHKTIISEIQRLR